MPRGRNRALNWYGHTPSAAEPGNQSFIAVGGDNGSIFSLLGGNTDPASDEHEQFVRERGDSTITRILGTLFVTAGRSAGSIVSIGVNVFAGIIVVPFEMYAAGYSPGAVPSPFADNGADWLWHGFARVGWRTVSHQVWNGSTVVNYAVDLGGDEDWREMHIDVRGQRRLRKGEMPVLIVEYGEVGTSGRLGGLGVNFSHRILLREP